VNEDELRVVGPATAQQLRRLRLSEDVFALQSEEVRGHLPNRPDRKCRQQNDESEGTNEWRQAYGEERKEDKERNESYHNQIQPVTAVIAASASPSSGAILALLGGSGRLQSPPRPPAYALPQAFRLRCVGLRLLAFVACFPEGAE
jgi:hypothetical protein